MEIKEIIKYRLEAGALAIIDNLQNIDVNDLIFNLYLPIKDEDTKKLILFYEKQLILAKIDSKKFRKTRYKQIKDITRWIKKENKYRLFADFSMYISRNLDHINRKVLSSYMNCLMDTWTNLSLHGQYLYGINTKNNPLTCKELYGDYDVWAYEAIERLKKNPKKQEKIMLEMIEYETKTNFIRLNERNITNLIFGMIGLINEHNDKFIYPFQNFYDHVRVIIEFPRIYHDNQYYINLLNSRNYFLNTDGVVVKCFNAGFMTELRYKEEFLEDGLIVLFRITNEENKYSMGFIDLRDGYLYTGWMNANEGRKYHKRLMNFILEVYCYLTCSIDQNNNKLVALTELNSLEEVGTLNEKQPGIYIEINDAEKGIIRKGSSSIHKAWHKVSGHLRKGNSSEIARANARLYGLVMPQGYTFVRPHTRGKKME